MLIYILGVDGSGKTTLARSLSDGKDVEYLYLQHRPMLLWLLKAPARVLFMRKTDQFADYDSYKERKNAVVSKRKATAAVYKWASYTDVVLQALPRVLAAMRRARTVVLDRYYLDWIVNLSVLVNGDTPAMLRDAKLLEGALPRADLHVFLDLPEEVAFARKNDIQSVRYLSERRARYKALIDHYNFHVIDANRDPALVRADVERLVADHHAAVKR